MASKALSRRMKSERGSRPWLEQTGAMEAAGMVWEGRRRPWEARWKAAALRLRPADVVAWLFQLQSHSADRDTKVQSGTSLP